MSSYEKGMYLLVNMAGKYFRLDYRFADKRKTLALGVYPDVKLVEARGKRDEAKKMIVNNVDPGQARKVQKSIQIEQAESSFEAVAREWHEKYSSNGAVSVMQKKLFAGADSMFSPGLAPGQLLRLRLLSFLLFSVRLRVRAY